MASSRYALSRRLVRVATCFALVAGCGTEPAAPTAGAPLSSGATQDPVVSAEPAFLTAAPGAPKIANPEISFWAKQGQDHTVRMYYHAQPGALDSSTFAELRLRRTSLKAYPDARPFAAGDSVLITMSLADPERLILELKPSGLKFSADRPASLKLSYVHTDAASASPSVEKTLRIWRRESSDQPWTTLATNFETGLHEVKADLSGFSGYAIAY
jgi:hypothetical protein